MFKKMIGNVNFKKKLASIALLMTLLVSQFSVFGDADTAKVLTVGERKVWYKDANLNGAETGFTKFALGGKIAYCVDYRYYQPTSGTVPTFAKRLSKQSTAVLVAGYPNVSAASLGCNSDEEARLATQLAFWNVAGIQGDCDSYVKLDLNKLSPTNGHGDDFYRALAAAKKLAAYAFNNPYNPNMSMKIDGSKADVKVVNGEFVAGPYAAKATNTNIGKYDVSLTQAPSSAYVTNAAGTKTTSIGAGDTFYIKWSSKEQGQTIKYTVKANGLKAYAAMYRNGKNGIQSVAQLEYDEVALSANGDLSFASQKGGIELIKMDQYKERIAGVVFELKDQSGNVIGTNTSDDNGIVRFGDLNPGTYTLTEKSAPNGYIMGTEPFTATVKTGETFRLEVVNAKQEGNLKIVKVDDENKPLEGVVFEIVDKNTNKVVDTLVTDSQGLATSKKLPLGNYAYREVKVPNGIILDSSEYNFELATNNQVVTKKIVNERKRGGLKIVKVDDANMPLENVTFQILDSNKNLVETITTNQEGIATTKELKNGKYYYKETKVPAGVVLDKNEYEFNIQDGNLVVKKIINQRQKGNLKIVKVNDANQPLANVKFEILNGKKEVVETLVTNEKGEATSKYLPVGTYYLREVSAPEGIIVDKTEKPFTIEHGKTITKTIVNQRIKGKLKVVKVDDENQPVANVKFEIKNSKGEVVETLTTDKDGVAVSKILPYGKYTAKEISAPAGYILDEKEFEFNVTENNKILVKKVVNVRIKGNLEIIKTDDNKEALEGVTFEILDSNKKVVTTVTTDKDGKASVKDLLVGKYYYREIKVPANIVLDNTLYEFEMNGNTVTKEIENKIIKGNLKVIKTDDVHKKPLANVKFEIYNENKDLVDTIVTDEKGEATSKTLPYGKYTYKETEVPDGIVLDSTEYPFEVTENEKVIIRKIVNVRIKGNLSILKLDSDTKEPIAGVKFQVLDSNGNVIETLTTDKDGKATSSTLIKGTYFFKEISAPEKYVVDGKEHKFAIKNNGDLVEKTVYNKAKELPVTGGLGTNTLILLVVSVLSTLGYVVFKKKGTNK